MDGNDPKKNGADTPPRFDAAFRAELETLMRWRRDVRRFRTDAVPADLLHDLLMLAALAPSVGNSQPWRFVLVEDAARRADVIADFERCNAEALADYEGERADTYASLKLAGLREAPVHLAVFCDEATARGQGLGRKTMPEMLAYSVVGAINALWLAARAAGIGLGWVSILDPDVVRNVLDVPEEWSLVGYLCLGYPEEEHIVPELQRAGWEARAGVDEFIFKR